MNRWVRILGCCSLAWFLSAGTPERLLTIPFQSAAVAAPAPFQVLLPAGYGTGTRRYPVLYLLHGHSGHAESWSTSAGLVTCTAAYPVIVVLPEGGNGWYTNAPGKGPRWADHFFQEVVPYVDAHFRTLRGPQGCAVAGLSMGGYGALKLALEHPGTFGFAASFSGAVRAPDWSAAEMRQRGYDDWLSPSVVQAFGPEGAPGHAAYSLARLLGQLDPRTPPPFLYLDCGTEDELGFLKDNQEFARLLQAKHLPHEYRERPGKHAWDFWDHQLREVLRILAETWQLPVGAGGA